MRKDKRRNLGKEVAEGVDSSAGSVKAQPPSSSPNNSQILSKYRSRMTGVKLPHLCEYPKCVKLGKKRKEIVRLCDFHESNFPVLCDEHNKYVRREMGKRFP